MLADHEIRNDAVDITNSVIVRAPAGSGKTYLLATRFVALLCTVDSPEVVLALTFGKKAAEEIHERVFTWLEMARDDAENATVDKATSCAYPDQVRQLLAVDRTRGWALLDNPEQLHIKTIDAFCQQIVGHDFFHYSKDFTVIDDKDSVYNTAVSALIATALRDEPDSPAEASAAKLVLHAVQMFHGDLDALRTFLLSALCKRDNWLASLQPFVGHDNVAQQLFHSKQTEALDALRRILVELVRDALGHYEHLPDIMQAARDYLQHNSPDAPLAHWASEHSLPSDHNSKDWSLLAEMLLTKGGEWRKRTDKSIGMPPQSDKAGKEVRYISAKAQLTQLWAQLADSPQAQTVRHCLSLMRILPTEYSDETHALVTQSMQLLHIAYVYLQATFREERKIDYAAIATEANALLEQDPDCLRAISEHYTHLLVDEFQDTSFIQLALLKRFTSEWQPHEKTVFFVGDPMQSIYAFREAQVATFLHVWQHGWLDFSVHKLTLQVNFRTQAHLVNWYNQAMHYLFADAASCVASLFNAIAYSPATAGRESGHSAPVRYLQSDDMPRAVCTALDQLRSRTDSNCSIAILTRTRNQACDLLPALIQSRYHLATSEVMSFAQSPYVRDVLVLLAWLYFPHDRYWQYALLRTAWFAISVTDIEWLHAHDWRIQNDVSQQENIPYDDRLQDIITRAHEFAKRALPTVRRMPWSELLAQTLTLLPNMHRQSEDTLLPLYRLLDTTSEGGVIDWAQLHQRLDAIQIAVHSTSSGPAIEIMTIHKAKGLEFDYVLLPYCDYTPKNSDAHPIVQSLFDDATGYTHALLAARSVMATDGASLYDSVQYVAKQSAQHEEKRLAYVALTRAKEEIICLGTVPYDKATDRMALLKALAATNVPTSELDNAELDGVELDATNPRAQATLASNLPTQKALGATSRFASKKMKLPKAIPEALPELESVDTAQQIRESQAEERGIVVHILLMQWLHGTLQLNDNTDEQASSFARWAHQHCIHLEQHMLLPVINRLLTNLRQDDTARWLKQRAPSLQIEQELYHTGHIYKPDVYWLEEGESGIAWVVDFKSTMPNEHEDITHFSERMRASYNQQLCGYQQALIDHTHCHTVHTALYCPLVPTWIAVSE